MKKIKLVIVINDFLVGGAQRLTADIISRLDKNRFDVTLVTLFQFKGRDDMYYLLGKDIRVSRLSFKSFADVVSWISLVKLLRRERPDVVLSNLFFSNTVARVLKPMFEYAVVTVEHNTYIHKTWLQQFIDRLLANVTYKVVAVSDSVKEFTSKQEGIPLDTFRVINNGIDIAGIEKSLAAYDRVTLLKELGLQPERTYIVSVGRLNSQKNPALLLKGFAQFASRHTGYDLLMVGDGGLKEALIKEAQELGIWDKVHILGSQSDVSRFYYLSEFFVLASRIEGFGLAHAEALASGLPLVSTKTAGPDKMIEEGKNGFFITDETPEGVAEALGRMVAAGPSSMKVAARNTAARYDITETVVAYETLLEEALAA